MNSFTAGRLQAINSITLYMNSFTAGRMLNISVAGRLQFTV